ncbi:MAG TPA: tetratricopeptide repeat protein [Anaerolineales bacterium]|nr:tetratricopeptide repeat protein [Anaerolineales bacterium]
MQIFPTQGALRSARKLLPPLALAWILSACQVTTDFLGPETETPTITPAVTVAPSPTPPPSATPVPTLTPSARIENAEWALFTGDYERALEIYNATLALGPEPEIEAAALLGIGRVRLATGSIDQALNILRDLVARFPDSPQAGDAHIFLAQVMTRLNRYEEAAAEYQAYLDRFPGVLDAYVYEWKGDSLRAAALPAAALPAYEAALETPRLDGGADRIRFKIGGALAESGDLTGALAVYAELLEHSSADSLTPALLLARGDLLARLGETAASHAAYTQAITEYPRAFESYLALVRLVEAGAPVDEYYRGLVDHYAGEHGLAVLAFDRFLVASPEDHDGSVHYFKGLSLRAIDSYDLAIAEWNELVQGHTSADPYWDDAWEAIGDTHWLYLGDDESAIAVYESFTARVPEHARAAEFLFFAAQIAERSGQLERAAAFWERIVGEYPAHWQAPRARFLAGITQYRLGRFEQAFAHFQTIQSFSSAPFDRSQALFWSAKTQMALGDPAAAGGLFEQAAAADPTGYYSERARDFHLRLDPYAPSQAYDLEIDWEAERSLAEGWVRFTFTLPENADLTSPEPLAADIRFVRGTALWNLGFYELARAEFESLRASMETDPAGNFRLANYLLDLGLYRTAIFSARQILTLAGMDDADTVHAPPWFNHVRFGTYYPDLVLPAAADNGVHPLLVWSVIRQESLFEGFVRSTAGARGLMQIIPSTGAGIHANLGWPEDYSAEDLYRPHVNVIYGVDYLADQINYFSGGGAVEPIHVYAALAAYNGGPGNSAAWLSQAQGDPDLFLEIIRFEETRRYVRAIYELYSLYVRFYGNTP